MSKSGTEIIKTTATVHFTGGLNENAVEHESVNFPAHWRITEINEILIKGVTIQSKQNLEWDIYLWNKTGSINANLDLDGFVDMINFPETIGKQIAGSGQYYYSKSNLWMPYEDIGRTRQLHISLVNRSATAKQSGVSGQVVVKIIAQPLLAT